MPTPIDAMRERFLQTGDNKAICRDFSMRSRCTGCDEAELYAQCSEVSVVLTALSHGVCGSSPSASNSDEFSMRIGSFHR